MDDKVTITVTRDDLSAFHRALESGLLHLDEGRGTESRAVYAERLTRVRRSALDAIWDHDDVPASERAY